jgi:non-heme chloroperoxidase
MRPDFPYGLPKEDITKIINSVYDNRPQMLLDTAPLFFFKPITKALSDWFFQLGFMAANWATAECAKTFRTKAFLTTYPKFRFQP